MKKAKVQRARTDTEMRAEYDFRGALRGKFYKPLHRGYTVRVHKANGKTLVRHMVLKEGTVALAPDVREYFPDSEAVNRALRCLIPIMPKKHRARSKV